MHAIDVTLQVSLAYCFPSTLVAPKLLFTLLWWFWGWNRHFCRNGLNSVERWKMKQKGSCSVFCQYDNIQLYGLRLTGCLVDCLLYQYIHVLRMPQVAPNTPQNRPRSTLASRDHLPFPIHSTHCRGKKVRTQCGLIDRGKLRKAIPYSDYKRCMSYIVTIARYCIPYNQKS